MRDPETLSGVHPGQQQSVGLTDAVIRRGTAAQALGTELLTSSHPPPPGTSSCGYVFQLMRKTGALGF